MHGIMTSCTSTCRKVQYIQNQKDARHLQNQGHPDEKYHESIKHTPAVLHIGVIPLYGDRNKGATVKRPKP